MESDAGRTNHGPTNHWTKLAMNRMREEATMDTGRQVGRQEGRQTGSHCPPHPTPTHSTCSPPSLTSEWACLPACMCAPCPPPIHLTFHGWTWFTFQNRPFMFGVPSFGFKSHVSCFGVPCLPTNIPWVDMAYLLKYPLPAWWDMPAPNKTPLSVHPSHPFNHILWVDMVNHSKWALSAWWDITFL